MTRASPLLFILKMLIILLFAGWVSLWILKPTQLWTRKWKQAEQRASKTFFSYHGLDFVVYTLPVIALAVIVSIYMELTKRGSNTRKPRSSFSALSNPLVITRLTGILSVAEAVVVCLFVMFLAWTFYCRFSNDLMGKGMMQVNSLKLNGWQFKFSRAATRCGLLAETCLALLFLPVLRTLAVFRFIGVQFESSVRYHVWLGTAMIFFATIHGTCTWFIWGINHLDEMWKWQRTGRIYLAGEIGLVIGLVIWVTSLPWFRRNKFEVFYNTHHLYIIFVIFFLFHAGDHRFYLVLPGIFLYGIDKLVRIVQSRLETSCVLSARIFPCKAVELTLPKDPRLKYSPTSIVFIKIPSISRFQWHCFSISSSSMAEEHTISIIIKTGGCWTRSLYERVQSELGSSKVCCIPVAIEGPYGPASLNLLRYESLLLVAGGSGITPFLSILQEIVYANQNMHGNRLPAEVQLIYVTKKYQDVSLLQPVIRLLAKKSTCQLRIRMRLFVTQERQNNLTSRQLKNELTQIELVRFNTKQWHNPIGGVESSFTMTVIVSCCSVLFLILICVFNAAFVHPTKKGKDKKKIPSTLTDAFLLCSFVAALACGMMVLIPLRLRRVKKDDDEKAKLSRSDEMDEIMDENAIEENCEINFTGRPCFKDIFSELTNDRRRSEIGVMVCGPETIKESVASSLPKLDRSIPGQPRFVFHSLTFTL